MKFGYTIRETRFNGSTRQWRVRDCETQLDAYACAYGWAFTEGWSPPRWWQWWRRNDTRLELWVVFAMATSYFTKYTADETSPATITRQTLER